MINIQGTKKKMGQKQKINEHGTTKYEKTVVLNMFSSSDRLLRDHIEKSLLVLTIII